MIFLIAFSLNCSNGEGANFLGSPFINKKAIGSNFWKLSVSVEMWGAIFWLLCIKIQIGSGRKVPHRQRQRIRRNRQWKFHSKLNGSSFSPFHGFLLLRIHSMCSVTITKQSGCYGRRKSRHPGNPRENFYYTDGQIGTKSKWETHL